jgi:hypothetical protein
MLFVHSDTYASQCLTNRLEYTFPVDCGFLVFSELYNSPDGEASPVTARAIVSESSRMTFRLETCPSNVAIVSGLFTFSF